MTTCKTNTTSTSIPEMSATNPLTADECHALSKQLHNDVNDEDDNSHRTHAASPQKRCDSMTSYSNSSLSEMVNEDESKRADSFFAFRLQYLIVHVAIMLADGMQGTHLYVLYEGYGYSVASLYCLGFVSGALTSPFIGPIVDRIGRKKSAVIYCVLEIMINLLEQYDILAGLIISRVVGGITTNLLFSVFEAWLVTEHRKRGFSEEKMEIVMRDSTVTSNMSAILSGYIAHELATRFGPVGPFEGAVASTFVALVLVATKWQENYGSGDEEVKSVRTYMREAYDTITSDSKIYRIGIIQGLTDGTLQTFVFLWSPALRSFSVKIPAFMKEAGVWGLDADGEPAYGLIFGAFMACGVLGGLAEPTVRQFVATFMTNDEVPKTINASHEENEEREGEKPVGVEFLAAWTYLMGAALLAVPIFVDAENPHAFSMSLAAFLSYEILIGLYMPCEGVIRSIYMPNQSICSLMTMLRVIINVIVAAGVFSTNFISFTSAFAAGSLSLVVAACLQLSLVEGEEWKNLSKNLTSIRKVRKHKQQ